MQIPDGMLDTFIGMIFESVVIVIMIGLLFLIYRHYQQRKTEYTHLMLWIFINYTLAILFSWLSIFLAF